MRTLCRLLAIVLCFAAVSCATRTMHVHGADDKAAETGVDAVAPHEKPRYTMTVAHPSLDPQTGMYFCFFALPSDYPINEKLGFGLHCVDREGQLVAQVGLAMHERDGERGGTFTLSREMIKNSYVTFCKKGTLDPVTIHPGHEQTFRRENGQVVREPIE